MPNTRTERILMIAADLEYEGLYMRANDVRHLVDERDTLRGLVNKIASIPLWRDVYPDGPDTLLDQDRVGAWFTPDDVRSARAICAVSVPKG